MLLLPNLLDLLRRSRKRSVVKNLKRIAIGVLSAALVLVCAGAGFLGLAVHRIASRMQAPALRSEPKAGADLVYRTLDGNVQHLSDNRGHVVFLNLWGTWCIPCVAEMPRLQKLYDHYRGDSTVRFLIVSRLDTPDRVRLFAREGGFTLPFYVTHDRDIPESMRFGQYPSTFVFGKDGRLVSQHIGPADWSDASVFSFLDSLRSQ